MKMYHNITHAIGNTPLVCVPFIEQSPYYAKLEYISPGGSIKDRSALFMIEEAERRGELRPGGTIIEASSGNQGIAASYIGIAKGYKVIITVSEKVSIEKRTTLEAYGVTVITCPATRLLTDPENYHQRALAIYKETPNSFMLNQYFNPDNARAHYTLLGPEIWQQTEGKVTHFIAGAGSCGTICGAGKYLKEQNKNINIIAVDSVNSYHTTCGKPQPYVLDGMGIDYDTPLLDMSVIDRFIAVKDKDAHDMLKTLARSYGFLVGPASGAVAWAAHSLAPELNADACVVMLFGDSGRAYLTKNLYTK
jgi:cystathionine beta-synthase